MISKKNFFNINNTVRSLNEAETSQVSNYLMAIEAVSRVSNSTFYIIDYQKQGFEYVSDNPLFLCGRTASEVQEMGYDFYIEHVEAKDLKLLLRVNQVGFDFYSQIDRTERINYSISYDFKLKTKNGKLILINHRLSPIFLTESGKIWKSICIVSLSNQAKSGNIEVYKKGSDEIYKYDLDRSIWLTDTKEELSLREKEILQLSIRGLNVSEIATALHISPNTVKFHRKTLFERIRVNNIFEAISYCVNRKLL